MELFVNPKLKAKNFSKENLSQNNLSHGHLISDSTGDPGPAPPNKTLPQLGTCHEGPDFSTRRGRGGAINIEW